jgi:hypothetical protein
MRHAKLEVSPDQSTDTHRPGAEGSALDETAVEQILNVGAGYDDGDPISGIRNALLASALLWSALVLLALAYLR